MSVDRVFDFGELTLVSRGKTPVELETSGQLKYWFYSSNPSNDRLMADIKNYLYTNGQCKHAS